MSENYYHLSEQDRIKLLPRRPESSHKGNYGHVVIIGGDHGMAGATRLAGEAAVRVGAGLVSIATRPDHAAIISAQRPELMSHGIKTPTELQPLLDKANAIVIGPGLGQTQWAQQLFTTVLQCTCPIIVDADALNLLAKKPEHRNNWILTPHPGEAARLLNQSCTAVQNSRPEAINALQKKYGGTIVLKGSGTLINNGSNNLALCNAGNPGMASGGMGDLLTGIIAGLIAQNLTIRDAANLGVYIHSKAGDQAALKGERGLIASDLLAHIRQLANPDIVFA